MIVVTFALPTESSAFIRCLKNVKRDGAVVRGNVEHRTLDICVVHTGVGAATCEERLGNFLRTETPELLIASGFCGGTTVDLSAMGGRETCRKRDERQKRSHHPMRSNV